MDDYTQVIKRVGEIHSGLGVVSQLLGEHFVELENRLREIERRLGELES